MSLRDTRIECVSLNLECPWNSSDEDMVPKCSNALRLGIWEGTGL